MRLFSKPTRLAALFLTFSLGANAQSLLEKANKQYELHAYRLAAQSYESVLARDADPSVSARLANAYFHLNELEKAATQFALAIKSERAQPDVVLNYGRVLMMLGRYDEAETQFKKYRATDSFVAENYVKSCQFARQNEDNMPEMTVSAVPKVNSSAADFGVSFYKNNLVWSSSRTDLKRAQETASKNMWSGIRFNQLFTAPIEGVSSTPFKVSFLKNDLKNTLNESNPSYSADGKTVAFMRNNFDDGERISSKGGMELSLFTAEVDEDGNWTNIKPFQYNAQGVSTGFPSLSPDGKTLYFASNRSGSMGGFDIFESKRRGDFWGEPRNLGSSVNTQGDEITPFHDGNNLFFASDFHTGYGGFDIFKLENSVSAPVNLGTSINTAGDEYSYIFDPSVKIGYFVSTRKGGSGKEDIFKVSKEGESANIVIAEAGTMKLIKDAKISVTQGNQKALSQLKGGNYLVDLADSRPVTVEVKKEGYLPKTFKIEPKYQKTTQIIEILLEKDLPVAMKAVPQHAGVVFDASTGDALEGVQVRATNQETNEFLEATTDKSGKFKFSLESNQNYLLSYSKESFVVGKKNVKASMSNRNLGEFTLKPSALTGKIELEVPQPVAQSKDELPENYAVTVKSAKKYGYAVQLLVTTQERILNLSEFDALREAGNLYVLPESGKQKLRLGVYQNREEANAALKKAVALGSKGAYVVEENNSEAYSVNKYVKRPQPKATKKTAEVSPVESGDEEQIEYSKVPESYDIIAKPAQKKPTAAKKGIKKDEIPTNYTAVVKAKAPVKALPKPKGPVAKDVPKSYNVVEKPKVEDKTFKVKIAAMKKAELFKDEKVAQLWKVDQEKQGDFVIFYFDGIKTLQQAKSLKAKVKEAGYKDAKVVVREAEKFKVVD